MAITAPTVSSSIEHDKARKNLQLALNLIAAVATTIGDSTTAETFNNPTIRAAAGHFIDIHSVMLNLASDDIPF